MPKEININIKELLKEKILLLNKNVTPEERAEAEKVIEISRPTLEKYLSGDIVKIETATRLVKFLNKKVQKRLTEINGMANIE